MAEEVSARRRRVVSFVWLVLFVGVGAFFSVLLTQALKDRQRHEVKRSRVGRTRDATRERVEQLKLEQEAIKTDPACVEDAAREMNWAKPGEIQYQRENVGLRKIGSERRLEEPSLLASLVDSKMDQWQVPLTVFAVIVIALLIVRGFRPREDESDVEGTQ